MTSDATTQSSLYLLAQVAERIGNASPFDDSDDSDRSSTTILSRRSSPSPCPGSDYQPKPPKRSATATSNAICGAHQLRPRMKAHKVSRLHVKPKLELRARRKELLDRAGGIKSLDNSPVNEQQLCVLRTVYDEITMYPSEPWLVLMAIILNRALKQVKNWFSNERQKNRWGDVVSTQTDTGERLRLRPSAIELCEQWSDAFFEEVVMIVNFKTIRRLQFERCSHASSFATDL
ncbi:hypothetical protein C8J57DRAFT_1268990 [Mycena rebaudengoi]|nr:hypothetical protein C8J57DRAFT_1268990 [Mycena rebaudengoi]